MHFLRVFLIFLLTLTLAQSEAITNLTHHEEAVVTFDFIDTDHDQNVTIAEFIASFEPFKEKPGDNNITVECFASKLFKQVPDANVTSALLKEYDLDGSGFLDESDYSAMYGKIDEDGDASVTANELMRYYNDMFIRTGSPVRHFNNETMKMIHTARIKSG